MWFVYFHEMTLKYLTLSSYFRFLFCFVFRIFFLDQHWKAVVLKSSGFLPICNLFRFKLNKVESCKTKSP